MRVTGKTKVAMIIQIKTALLVSFQALEITCLYFPDKKPLMVTRTREEECFLKLTMLCHIFGTVEEVQVSAHLPPAVSVGFFKPTCFPSSSYLYQTFTDQKTLARFFLRYFGRHRQPIILPFGV